MSDIMAETRHAIIDSMRLTPYTNVGLAGWRGGRLDEALAAANETGRDQAAALLDTWLPGITANDRRADDAGHTVISIGEPLRAMLTTDRVLSALDGLDAHPGRASLYNAATTQVDPGVPADFQLSPGRKAGVVTIDLGRAWDRMLNHGSLLSVGALDRVMPELATLAEAAERTTGSVVSGGTLITGASTEGLNAHCDIGVQWVLQIAGTKRWNVWEPQVRWYDPRIPAPIAPPTSIPDTFEMRPGLALAMPLGCPHRVEPSGDLTISVNFTIDTPSRASLMKRYLESVGDDPRWLEPIRVAGRPSDDHVIGPGAIDLEAALCSALATFRAGIPVRRVAGAANLARILSSGRATEVVDTIAWRAPLGGGAHPVQDIPWEDSVVFAAAGRVVHLWRSYVDGLALALSGSTFSVEELAALTDGDRARRLVADLAAEGLLVPVV